MAESLPNKGELVSDEVKTNFKDRMDELLVDVGRTITLNMKPSIADCPNCGFDHILNRSNNRYDNTNPNTLNSTLHRVFLDGQTCPVCFGAGMLKTSRTTDYTATISSKFKEREILEAGLGKINKGLTKTLTVIESYDDIINCQSALIDGSLFRVIGEPRKSGLQDLIRVRTFWERSE